VTEDEHPVSARWTRWRAGTDLEEYFSRWNRMAAQGQATHGEADLVESFHPQTVLDAGCGMGRVAIELARRGIDVVGIDLDDEFLAYARRAAPDLQWVHADLATTELGRHFDVVVLAGNVMIFCRPEDRGEIIGNMAAHLAPGGRLIAGFDVEQHAGALSLSEYDVLCEAAGLTLETRSATWEGAPYSGGNYAVSVHHKH
jgi:SAM-dependent methyltransferase